MKFNLLVILCFLIKLCLLNELLHVYLYKHMFFMIVLNLLVNVPRKLFDITFYKLKRKKISCQDLMCFIYRFFTCIKIKISQNIWHKTNKFYNEPQDQLTWNLISQNYFHDYISATVGELLCKNWFH